MLKLLAWIVYFQGTSLYFHFKAETSTSSKPPAIFTPVGKVLVGAFGHLLYNPQEKHP